MRRSLSGPRAVAVAVGVVAIAGGCLWRLDQSPAPSEAAVTDGTGGHRGALARRDHP